MNLYLSTKLVELDDYELILSFGNEGVGMLIFSIIGIIISIIWIGNSVACIHSIENLKQIHLKIESLTPKQKSRLRNMLDFRPAFVSSSTLASNIAKSFIVFFSFIPAPYLISVYYYFMRGGNVNVEVSWFQMFMAAGVIFIPALIISLVFGELVPKTYATVHPVYVSTYLFPFAKTNGAIYRLLSYILLHLASLVTRRFGKVASFLTVANATEEEIKTLANSAEATGEMEADEKKLIHSVFQFGDTIVREIMTPRVDLSAVPITATRNDVIRLVGDTGYSRIPVYKESGDMILGIIHAKDLLLACASEDKSSEKNCGIREFIRPVLHVPETKRLNELLEELKSKRMHMAVVQDEFGGTAGVVTVEDIIEELVGDIVDEYDMHDEPDLCIVEDGFSLDGKMSLSEVNEYLDTKFSSEEFDTIGGYVFGLFGKQPLVGESISDEECKFTVLETDGRRVSRVKVAKDDKLKVEAIQEDEWFR